MISIRNFGNGKLAKDITEITYLKYYLCNHEFFDFSIKISRPKKNGF